MNINPFDLLKNAQKIQEQMGGFQERLASVVVTGNAGAGMVEIDLNGKSEMIAVRISPEAASDLAMLQDLIVAAHNNAQEKVKEAAQGQMQSFAREMGLPAISPGTFPGF
ncbi:MAG: YbaB/EbfC family nucleoid-associated protein [Termitinemataceae bacterium]|nr:MAG: YbaB/EbfC family nucleoid-associated protein [Termitinemataceae bacterium]